MAHTHRDFFVAFLKGLRLPVRVSGLRTLAAVSIFESSQGNLRWNNPLACTLPYNGSTKLYPNEPGAVAQIYKTFSDGVEASVELFSGPHWENVRNTIEQAKYRGPILDAFSDAYTWADIDFRHADFNKTDLLDQRLAHTLLGP